MIIATGKPKDSKVVIIGSSSVGKSSLVTMLTRDVFPENCPSTVGAAFVSKTFKIGEKEVGLQIWDTSGSERYKSMVPMYFQNAQAAVIVYDITNLASFNDISFWLKELREKGPEDIIVALAGNKLDLQIKREVNTEDAIRFATKNNIKVFKETSALERINVEEIFADLAHLIISDKPIVPELAGVELSNSSHDKKVEEKKGCC